MIPLPGGLLVKGIVVLALVAGIVFGLWRLHASIRDSGFRDGYAKGHQELLDYQDAQTDRTVEVIREVEKVVTQVEIKYVDRIRVVRERGETIVKEVPVYVTKADDSACELRNGSLRIHDAAARNESPGPAQDSDREAGGVELHQVLQTIGANYSTCLRWREQVTGWQDFWGRYSEALSKAVCLPK